MLRTLGPHPTRAQRRPAPSHEPSNRLPDAPIQCHAAALLARLCALQRCGCACQRPTTVEPELRPALARALRWPDRTGAVARPAHDSRSRQLQGAPAWPDRPRPLRPGHGAGAGQRGHLQRPTPEHRVDHDRPRRRAGPADPAHSELIGVVVEHELLAALWQSMYQKPLSAWIEEQIVVQASTASARHLNKMHRRILDLLSSSPELLNDPVALIQLRDAILIEWIEAIPSQVDTSELRRMEARKKVVDRACECMLAHSDQPLSTLDVCSRIGTSPRKLDYCFNDVLGISPKRYLRLVRLNGVRRDLKSRAHEARVKVQDVAARWGFWHLSEFSRDYSAQFGELPSQTLRNAQG